MFKTFLSEWKSFLKNKKHFVFIGAIALIPIIYCGMFLWSFWSPYDHTEHLPVAVVNEDQGAELAGEQVNVGDDLVDDLKKNDSFEWKFVSQDKADKEMDNNHYYMTITIPKNFSKDATTVLDDQTTQPKFEYKLNSGYNYIASKITDAGAKEIKEKLNHQLTKTYTDNMFGKIDELADGLKEASDGTGDLSKGAQDELDGLQSLKSHLQESSAAGSELLDGADQLATGATSLQSGIAKTQAGTNALYKATKDNTGKVNDLADGTATLAEKTSELNAGIQKLVNGNQEMVKQLNGDELAKGLSDLSKGMQAEYDGLAALNQGVAPLKDIQQPLSAINQYITSSNGIFTKIVTFTQKNQDQLTPQQKSDLQSITEDINTLAGAAGTSDDPLIQLNKLEKLPANVQKLTDGQKDLLSGFNDLSTKLQQLSTGLTTLQNTLNQLPNATGQLAAGTNQVAKGSEQLNQQWGTLVQNIGQINDAERQLQQGSEDLQTNLVKLENGMKQMNNGQDQLTDGATKLTNGAKDIHSGSDELANKLGDAYKQTNDSARNDKNAQMFSEPLKTEVSAGDVNKYGVGFTPYFLSLGLFVGALLLTVIYDVVTPAVRPRSGVAWAFGKYMFMGVVGIVQAIIADCVIFFAIGLHVSNPAIFVLFSILTSLVFMAIIQFFTSLAGEPGRFMVILILVLQLTTTGGTYPIELLPSALYNFHEWLPMNYSIAGFRNIVAGGEQGLLAHNTLFLACFGVVFLAGTVICLIAKHNKQFKIEARDGSSASM